MVSASPIASWAASRGTQYRSAADAERHAWPQALLGILHREGELADVDAAAPDSLRSSEQLPEEVNLDLRCPGNHESSLKGLSQRRLLVVDIVISSEVLCSEVVNADRGRGGWDRGLDFSIDRFRKDDSPLSDRHRAEGHDLVSPWVEAGELEIHGHVGRVPPRHASSIRGWTDIVHGSLNSSALARADWLREIILNDSFKPCRAKGPSVLEFDEIVRSHA